MVITIQEFDISSKHMYTKAGKNRGYVESTYHGGVIIMTYDLSGYKGKLESMNLVQENHIPFHIMRSLLTCTDELQQVFGLSVIRGRSQISKAVTESGLYK